MVISIKPTTNCAAIDFKFIYFFNRDCWCFSMALGREQDQKLCKSLENSFKAMKVRDAAKDKHDRIRGQTLLELARTMERDFRFSK